MSISPSDCQAELNLRTKAVVTHDAVAELRGLLRGRGWVTAAELRGLRPKWSERFIRLLANASFGRVLSWPGSPGYRLTIEASAEEREEAVAKLRHQALEMGERASAIARVHHACPREAADASPLFSPSNNPQPVP